MCASASPVMRALELGQPCPAPSACRSGYCPRETGVCTAIAVAGEPCTETQLCSGGSCSTIGVCADVYCDDEGMCRQRRAVGDACTSSNECESIECVAATGQWVERSPQCDGA